MHGVGVLAAGLGLRYGCFYLCILWRDCFESRLDIVGARITTYWQLRSLLIGEIFSHVTTIPVPWVGATQLRPCSMYVHGDRINN